MVEVNAPEREQGREKQCATVADGRLKKEDATLVPHEITFPTPPGGSFKVPLDICIRSKNLG